MTNATMNELKAYCQANDITVTGDKRRKESYLEAISLHSAVQVVVATDEPIYTIDNIGAEVQEVEAPEAVNASYDDEPIYSLGNIGVEVQKVTVPETKASTTRLVQGHRHVQRSKALKLATTMSLVTLLIVALGWLVSCVTRTMAHPKVMRVRYTVRGFKSELERTLDFLPGVRMRRA